MLGHLSAIFTGLNIYHALDMVDMLDMNMLNEVASVLLILGRVGGWYPGILKI